LIYDDLYPWSQDKNERGLEHAEVAVAEDPDNVMVRLLRANLYRRVRRDDDARRELRQIEKLESLTAADCIKLGDILNNMHEHDRALLCVERAAKLEPLSHNGYIVLGLIQEDRGQPRLALAAYDKAIEQYPLVSDFTYADGLGRRLEVHMELGNYREALADCNLCLSINPDGYMHVYKRRALAHFNLGNYADALADIRTSLKLAPEDLSALNWIDLSAMGRCPDASFRWGIIDLMSESIDRGETAVRVSRARMYLAVQRPDLATRDFEELVEKLETSTEAQLDCYGFYPAALIALELNRREDYKRMARAGITRSVNSVDIEELHWANWTTLLIPGTIDHEERFLELTERLLQAKAEDKRFLLTRGAAFFRLGQFADAKRYLLRADKQPDDPRTSPAYIWYFLAMTEHQLGNHDGAREQMDKATAYREEELRKDRDSPGALAWNRRLTLDLLAAEAGALITTEANTAPE
jgi:tetratricopeptide (TPR) repeat protein